MCTVIHNNLNNNLVSDTLPAVSCMGSFIEREQDLKYLGIIFDRSLSFNKHVTNMIQKAKRGINVIKVMATFDMQQWVLFLLLQVMVLSVIDYGLGLLTLSQTQVDRLEKVQNEAMRAVLGCTRDTPIYAMRFLLDLPSIRVRHQVAQVRSYFKVSEYDHHPLHPRLDESKGKRIKRGRSWMAEAEDTLRRVCEIEEIGKGSEWVEVDTEKKSLTKVIIQLDKACRKWTGIRAQVTVHELAQLHSKPQDIIIYTDGSVNRNTNKSGGALLPTKRREVR